MNRLILIDGNAAMHRAYHAIPPMRTAGGAPANAVYGFASMVIKVFGDLHPTHIAVAFDREAPTFRKKLFAGYQSKRPKMDDDLSTQIDLIHTLVTAFGIPIYEQDGFEADDVIGTICRQVARSKKIDQVIIMTGDRDILQLVVDEKVMVYMPTKGLSEGKIYSEKDVVERMGVAPDKIPDFKALAGDPSDNYPGVPGIGPKTAITLVDEFGSVEQVYKKLSSLSKNYSVKIIEKIKAGKDSAMLSKNLATIRTDAPVTFEAQKARIVTLDTPQSRAEIEVLNFPSLLRRLNDQNSPSSRVGIGASKSREEAEGKKAVTPQSSQQELF